MILVKRSEARARYTNGFEGLPDLRCALANVVIRGFVAIYLLEATHQVAVAQVEFENAIQGTWEAFEIEEKGESFREEVTFSFSNRKITYVASDQKLQQGTYRITGQSEPYLVDMSFVNNKERYDSVGIMKIEGENLWICLVWSEHRRPTRFDGSRESGQVLYKLRREKTQDSNR